MKRFLTITNSIFFVLILALAFASLTLLNRMRAVEESAATLVDVSEIRAAFSLYMAEYGVYPTAERLVLGKENAAFLCIGETESSLSGFFSSAGECDGKVILQLTQASAAHPFLYSSNGSSYSVDFSLTRPLGAYKTAGDYCATEGGVLAGRCE